MADAPQLTKGFSSDLDQPPDDLNYRPVCGTAIAAMVLGASSFAAFFSPVLWAVGFFALVICCYALYRIYTTTPPRLGRTPALIGLGLCLLFTTGAVVRHFSLMWLVRTESREVAELWLDAISHENMTLVHQLTKEPLARDPRLDTLEEVYQKNTALSDELAQFTEGDRLTGLIEAAVQGNVRLESATEVLLEDGFDLVTWRLIARGDDGEQPYVLATRRAAKFRGEPGGWQITSIALEPNEP